MRGTIPPLTQYASMAWCSVKKKNHRDNFTFHLILNIGSGSYISREMKHRLNCKTHVEKINQNSETNCWLQTWRKKHRTRPYERQAQKRWMTRKDHSSVSKLLLRFLASCSTISLAAWQIPDREINTSENITKRWYSFQDGGLREDLMVGIVSSIRAHIFTTVMNAGIITNFRDWFLEMFFSLCP
jgi:hypothetical protein